ncbi:MAG: hypothetical protein C0622_12785 [Desulfuromonas sp.]|nr:MAG: hypothetical protein C0622_12785 [Desulfuromonas sp.]
MSKSVKAVLLSALVFPGAGHLFLKKYIAGILLICSSLLTLSFFIGMAVERATQIAEKILSGEIQPDVATLMDMVTDQASGSDPRLMNIALILFIFFWVVGIVDSYLIARKTS